MFHQTGTIANTANVTGSFILVPGEPPVIVNQPSNTTLTTVNRGRFNVIKQVNRAATLVGDVLTYTVQITNTGTVTANDVPSLLIRFQQERHLYQIV